MRTSSKYFLDKLPEDAKTVVVKRKLVVTETSSLKGMKRLYSKKRYIFCEDGYDILQNLLIVRHYVCKKNDIPFNLLELMLYLFPLNYFTHTDYGAIPKSFTFRTVATLLKQDVIVIAVSGENRGKHLYALSSKSKGIVKMFYQMLSGEKKIPETNTMFTKSDAAIDKRRVKFIPVLNRQEIPLTKKKLFS